MPCVLTVVAVTDRSVRGVPLEAMAARAERERRSLAAFVAGPVGNVRPGWHAVCEWLHSEHGAYAAGKSVGAISREEKLMYAPKK